MEVALSVPSRTLIVSLFELPVSADSVVHHKLAMIEDGQVPVSLFSVEAWETANEG